MVTQVNHTKVAQSLMLSQFKNAEDLHSLLASWTGPLDEIEQALIDFLNGNGVTNAVGTMLDIIGSWVGVDRDLRNDTEYRQAILGKVLLETMDGTCRKFYQGMKTLCNTDEVTFHEGYPTTVYPQLGEGWTNATYDQLKAIKMAGVGFVMLVDYHLDSMKFSEVISQDNNLITPSGDDYEVLIDGVTYNLIVSKSASSITDGSGDYLAELIDEEFTPMAELVTQSYTVVEGFIVDSNGDFVVDESGNNYTYREFM